jgi:RNA polymerase sigma-70 factor (ECF subfamily)
MDSGDLHLARSLVAGDPAAFEPFVERFGPLILNFGRRMCGHRDDADEVLQETLLKAYLSVKDLKEPAALKSWVYRVAANACLLMRRRGRHAPRHEIPLDEVVPRAGQDGEPPHVADWSNIPLSRLLQGELKEKIEQAILDLPGDFRIVLVLRDQEGFSTREVANILGINEALARVRLHRARLALRRMLEGYLATAGDGTADRETAST